MQVIVDRIEGDKAVLELPDMTTVDAPLRLFPGAKEGDVYRITKDVDETAGREQRVQDKFERLKGSQK